MTTRCHQFLNLKIMQRFYAPGKEKRKEGFLWMLYTIELRLCLNSITIKISWCFLRSLASSCGTIYPI